MCNKKVIIAEEAKIIGFFLFKQVSPNGYSIKIKEGFESKGNKGQKCSKIIHLHTR